MHPEGSTIYLKVKPAIIEKDDGRSVLIYAGQREEIVEDALRKLAVKGAGLVIEGKASVMFSLHQLRQHLAKLRHTYSF